MTYVTHLEAAIDGTRLPAGVLSTVHENRPLWVRYDLDAVAAAVSRDDLSGRPMSLWRYRELLPYAKESSVVSLGETVTPLVDCPRLAAELGVAKLIIKDESTLPTGSFKARGMAMAVTMARELGVTRMAIPTAGNAGGALAAYAARAAMDCWVFLPDDTPIVNRLEAGLFGAKVFAVNGLINHCGAMVKEGAERLGWFDMSTLREPYRIEGKKTMGLELAEQCGWSLPDVVLYPTGGGTGLIGMWKAFGELEALGWLNDERRPRLFSCQSTGCSPIATAFDAGERFASEAIDPATVASGLRVPKALGDFMILDAVAASGGRAMAAPEERLLEWMRLATTTEGVSLCPESAACLGVLDAALAAGHIKPDETVVLFNTGAVQKYVEVMQTELPRLDRHDVDWELVEG
ncbi:MAG: threonine synthase [Pseudohongiellaceae bacterium]|jgi:threonine synthase